MRDPDGYRVELIDRSGKEPRTGSFSLVRVA
jgi:hypothetical protein